MTYLDDGLVRMTSWRIAAGLVAAHPDLRARWEPDPESGPASGALILEAPRRLNQPRIRFEPSEGIRVLESDWERRSTETRLLPWHEVVTQSQYLTTLRIEDAASLPDDAPWLHEFGRPEWQRRNWTVRLISSLVAQHVVSGARFEVRSEVLSFAFRQVEPPPPPLNLHDAVLQHLEELLDADVPPLQTVWFFGSEDGTSLAAHDASYLLWVEIDDEYRLLDVARIEEVVGEPIERLGGALRWLARDADLLRRVRLADWSDTRFSLPAEDEPELPLAGELGVGVIETVDGSAPPTLVIAGDVEFDEDETHRTYLANKGLIDPQWAVRAVPLDDAPISVWTGAMWPGPTDPRDGFGWLGEEDRVFRAVRAEDAAWISRFDVDLPAGALRELITVLSEVRHNFWWESWGEDAAIRFAQLRDRTEELWAITEVGGSEIRGLLYLTVLRGRFRSVWARRDGEWSHVGEAVQRTYRGHWIATPEGRVVTGLEMFERTAIHPTMARSLMERFDREGPIDVEAARPATGQPRT